MKSPPLTAKYLRQNRERATQQRQIQSNKKQAPAVFFADIPSAFFVGETVYKIHLPAIKAFGFDSVSTAKCFPPQVRTAYGSSIIISSINTITIANNFNHSNRQNTDNTLTSFACGGSRYLNHEWITTSGTFLRSPSLDQGLHPRKAFRWKHTSCQNENRSRKSLLLENSNTVHIESIAG